MQQKLKLKKCKTCKAEFQPKTEWQKFCRNRCRAAAANSRKADILRRARKIVEAQAVGQ